MVCFPRHFFRRESRWWVSKGKVSMKSTKFLTQVNQRGTLVMVIIGWILAAVMGLALTAPAQTLDEVQASVGQLSDEAGLLSKALSEIGQQSLVTLKKCRIARWTLSRSDDSAIADAVGVAVAEASTLDEQLQGLLESNQELSKLVDDPQSVSSVVESLIDNEALDGDRGDQIQQKLLELSDTAVALTDDAHSLQSKSYDIKDALSRAQTAATATPPDLEATRGALTDCVKTTLAFSRERRTVVLPKKAAIVRLLKEIHDLLSATGPVTVTSTMGKSGAVKALDKAQRAHEIAMLGQGVAAIRVKVYSTDGKLLFAQEAAGNRLQFMGFDQAGRALANGVYIYAVSALGPDGQVLRTELKKFVIRR